MKLLLDECVTNFIKPVFVGHDVTTIEDAGLKGLKNGVLLNEASGRFDVLITVDQNLQYQQNLENVDIAILILRAPRATYPFLKQLIPVALDELRSIEPGQIVIVS